MNSNDLRLPDNSYDRAMIFFLPHEQPDEIRRKTFTEAFRVVKPGGHIYITEFSRSKWYHPLRYIWYPVLMVLEPFARAVWRNDMATFLPHGGIGCTIEKREIFARFYQCVKVTTPTKR
jgi:ubiquinone/menaquinone biosynthesis C-methylase UbiE